ncbi:putative quinol monooxygenase [Arthrobacter sp. GMC3]|uniref:putative quinol monooxygenase n=1 Tax=Arthrobacter sp. GMC3 TaxID=2058894 RepID=UPI000CE430C5|nr:antibiotic biosynthesis monooxygenase family protein [Arthrobacter sp. GMC3]
MNTIDLTGQLICKGDDEIAVVTEFLPRHIELTHAEPGCISFEVNPTDDPRVWNVAERFQDADSFHSHQARVKASDWGRATAGIKRSYSITGL